ncbi:MAG TPA: tetratricopeptide repeat protein [Opitutaceae bacterium]|nr:tetratricopeptide repeat protein [Opitutaceae bacterium]
MVRRLAILLCLCVPPARAATPLDDAIGLYQSRQYPLARAAFEKIAAAEPANAVACFYLGQTLLRRGDRSALDDAVVWLEKAAQLQPGNSTYLAAFGGASLQLAQKNTSFTAATKGRDAMEQAIRLDPANLDAREGLMQFYERAPWPLGSTAKADAELEEIRRRDPDRATVLSVIGKANAKDYAAAFQICDRVLAKTPDNYVALYQFGRTASFSGQNLERGLACLQKCLTLSPPGPASPQPTHVWQRIGVIQEKLGHPAEARTAYETSLRLDGGNKSAADALAKLKP